MRLMEFIFSSCNDETLMDDNNDESDDSFDIALKEAKLKRGKSTREYLADLDAEDEKKGKQKRNLHLVYLKYQIRVILI